MQSGRYSEACEVCGQIIRMGGKSSDVQSGIYQQGVCLNALEQYEEAIASCKSLEQYPGWKETVLLPMGNVYAENLQMPDKAAACYEKLLRENPKNKSVAAEAHYRLGTVSYMQGDYRQAKFSLETAIALQPPDALIRQAQEWLERTSNAIVAVKKPRADNQRSFSEPAKQSDAGTNMLEAIAAAEALQGKGDYGEALKGFQRIVKNLTRGKGYDRALFRLGQCQAALGDEREALASWDRILALARMKQPCDYADDSLLAQADTWLNAIGNPDNALKCCRALQSEFPRSDLLQQAEHIVGMAHFYRGDLDQARIIFERELARQNAELARRQAEDSTWETESGKTAEVTSAGRPITGLDRLVAACRDRKLAAHLGARFKAAARSAPMIRLGDMQFASKEYGKALRSYMKAAREKWGSESAAYAMLQAGRCHNQLRQYRQALLCYEEFMTKYKDSEYADDALLRAGVIYVGPLHDMKSGAEMYKMVLERYPDSNEAETALYHLATLAYWQKDWRRALALYRQTAETWPKGKYCEFIASKKMPELMSLIKSKSKTKKETS